MNAFSGLLAATVVTALMAGGCNSMEKMVHSKPAALEPAISLEGPRQVAPGELQRVIAHTKDTAGSRAVQWMVEPSTARITPENSTAGQTAMFTANQRGRYIITARVEMGNGQPPVQSSTTVDVVGGPAVVDERMTEPRMNEPAPAPAPNPTPARP